MCLESEGITTFAERHIVMSIIPFFFLDVKKKQLLFCYFFLHWGAALYLQHGLLVFTVLHLSRGQVEDASFHRVLVAVVDEDVGPTHHHEVLHPRVGARLHEAQEAFLGYYRSTKRTARLNLPRGE